MASKFYQQIQAKRKADAAKKVVTPKKKTTPVSNMTLTPGTTVKSNASSGTFNFLGGGTTPTKPKTNVIPAGQNLSITGPFDSSANRVTGTPNYVSNSSN